MKQWKLVISFVAVVTMLLLVACGGNGDHTGNNEGNNTPSNTSKNNDGENNTEASADKITIFQSKVEISEQLEELAEVYTEETGVEVEVWGTTGDGYFQQLQVHLSGDQGPSIFSVGNIIEAEKLESYIYDMSNEGYVQDIAPNMELDLDGKTLGVPYGIEGFGLVYNKDLVNPEDVTDYDSFVHTLESLKADDINGLSLSQEAFFLIGHLSNYPFAMQDDYLDFIEQMNNGEVTLSEIDEFKEFAKFMEAIKEHTNNPLDVTYDEQVGDFATGKTAMIHQGNWAYGMLEDFDIDFEVGMMPFPLMGNENLSVGVGSYWAVNDGKSDEEIKAANDFINWLVSSETGQKYIVDDFGFVPAMTNIEANDIDPLSTEALEASNDGKTIPWAFDLFPENMIVNDFAPAADKFFLSDMTAEEFIDELQAGWENATK